MDNKLRKILQPNANGFISDGMDLSILVIENQKLRFAAAGNRIYMYSNTEITEIKGSISPLGSFSSYPKKEYLSYEVNILPNHSYYIFSDGFKDQFGEREPKKYGSKQFKELLLSIGKLPMFAQREKMEESWLDWKGNTPQTDDVLVIGLQLL
jgi:serine phosphatase RsbU (regulator of sigma subunit)